jgi:hypothetical protein
VLAAGAASAGDKTSSSTDPGFNPNTGQINPGHAPTPWSATPVLPQDNRPPQQQARAALMMPDPVGVSSLGQGGAAPATTGADASVAPATPPGPIGATLQTMPAKFSKRNDMLDHLPIMAWPLRLSDEQQRQIVQAVMADKAQAAPAADALKPASMLSYKQTRDMHPLPQQLSAIDGLQGLQYVKGKNKVLLVRPTVGIVVDEIAL